MRDRADMGSEDEGIVEEYFPEENADHAIISTSLEETLESSEDGAETQAPLITVPSIQDPPEIRHDGNVDSSVDREERSPRPLVSRRSTVRHNSTDSDDLMSVLKAQIIQDGLKREEEHRRREQEWRDREEDRKEERARRDVESRRKEEERK